MNRDREWARGLPGLCDEFPGLERCCRDWVIPPGYPGGYSFRGWEQSPTIEYTLQNCPSGNPGCNGLGFTLIEGNLSQSQSEAKYLSGPQSASTFAQMIVQCKVANFRRDGFPDNPDNFEFPQWNCLKNRGWILAGLAKLSDNRPYNMGYVEMELDDSYGLVNLSNQIPGQFEVPLITTSPGWLYDGFEWVYTFRFRIRFSGDVPANVDRWGLTLGDIKFFNTGDDSFNPPGSECPDAGYYTGIGNVIQTSYPDGPVTKLYRYACPPRKYPNNWPNLITGITERREWQLFTRPFRPGRFDTLTVPNPFG